MQTLLTQGVLKTSLYSGILHEANGFEKWQLLALSPRQSVGLAVSAVEFEEILYPPSS